MKSVVVEALLVGVCGATVGLAVNFVSPRGLHDLKRDYLGAWTKAPVPAVGPQTSGSPLDTVLQELRQAGLRAADSNQVAQFYRDPRCQQDRIVFLDARDPEHYEAGHIPGAYVFDYFHAEKYLDAILPLCQNAEVIVVYCNGGDCEDSLHAATLLTEQANIPKEKMWVYTGGITEWVANAQPVETGARNSGKLAGK